MNKSTLTLSLLIVASILTSDFALAITGFRCGGFTQSERRVSKPEACDDTGGFGLITEEILNRKELALLFANKTEAEISVDTHLKNIALESKFRITSNMNGAKFTFPSGITRVVFRGSYQAPMFTDSSVLKRVGHEPDNKKQCMKNLIKKFDLQKIVNYDELDWESAVHLTKDEKDYFLKENKDGKYWEFTKENAGRTFQYKFSKIKVDGLSAQKKVVMDDVAAIIRQIEGLSENQGAAYIHCYGGHHRTGAVWGVLQKCIGKMNVEDVIAEYKCHIGYASEQDPGGYHKDNETLIREFPCEQYWK